jgi:hypothetical protein
VLSIFIESSPVSSLQRVDIAVILAGGASAEFVTAAHGYRPRIARASGPSLVADVQAARDSFNASVASP